MSSSAFAPSSSTTRITFEVAAFVTANGSVSDSMEFLRPFHERSETFSKEIIPHSKDSYHILRKKTRQSKSLFAESVGRGVASPNRLAKKTFTLPFSSIDALHAVKSLL